MESQTSRVCLDRRTTQRSEGEAGLAGATGRDGYNMRQGERKEPAVSNGQRRHVVVEQRSPGKLTTVVGTHGFEHMMMDIWHHANFFDCNFISNPCFTSAQLLTTWSGVHSFDVPLPHDGDDERVGDHR